MRNKIVGIPKYGNKETAEVRAIRAILVSINRLLNQHIAECNKTPNRRISRVEISIPMLGKIGRWDVHINSKFDSMEEEDMLAGEGL